MRRFVPRNTFWGMIGLWCCMAVVALGQSSTGPLFAAIAAEDIAATRVALTHGASMTAVDARGFTPLTAAAEQGNAALFQVVLDAAPDINARDRLGRTAVITATWLNQMDVLRILIDRHADLNVQEAQGRSALFYAERQDRDPYLPLLLESGADPNLVDKAGTTALSQAIVRSEHDNAVLLRHFGAQFAGPNDELYAATASGDIATMTRLLDQEHADANFHRNWGQPMLAVAAQKGNTVAVRVLLAHGADPNQLDSNRQPPLYWAMTSGHASTAEALMDAGASLTAQTPGHRTLLVTAAAYGMDAALLHRLLVAGVPIDQTDLSGGTALMAAAGMGKHEAVRMLLQAGANPTLCDQHGQTAADFARRRKDEPLANLLEASARSWTPRADAALNLKRSTAP